MAQRLTVNLSLPPAYARALRDLADSHHGANVSAAVRALLDARLGPIEAVTKSPEETHSATSST